MTILPMVIERRMQYLLGGANEIFALIKFALHFSTLH